MLTEDVLLQKEPAALRAGQSQSAPEDAGAAESKKLRCVYLCSAPHSGSTLLACLLGAHPQVSTVGEFGATFNSHGKCSCGVPYDECDVWKRWRNDARHDGLELELGNLGVNLEPRDADRIGDLFYYHFPLKVLDGLRDRFFARSGSRWKAAATVVDRYYHLARLLCRQQETNVFLDTTKNAYQIRFLAADPRIDLKMIALVRDGRGVTNSLINREKWTPERSVGTWTWANRNIARAAKYLPRENVLWLRLEDLCHEPEAMLDRLQRFCGATPCLTLDASNTSERHVIGNSMRLSFDGRIKLDEKWRTSLSAENLALFERRAGKLNRRLGYSD